MEPLVLVGLVVAAVALAAVVWLRWRRRYEPKTQRPAEPAAKKASWTRSEVLSLAGIAVGAAVGVAGLVLSGGGGSPASQSDNQPNPVAYAALLQQGPFTEDLPDGLEVKGLAEENVADASAAGAVAAEQLEVSTKNAPGVTGVFAHFEVYQTPEAATKRAEERVALLKRIVGPEKVQGNSASYCSYETIRGPTSWECGGTSGLVYAEATITPNPNATQYLATETAQALLGYADEKARVAGG
jgi:hypothetical protein